MLIVGTGSEAGARFLKLIFMNPHIVHNNNQLIKPPD